MKPGHIRVFDGLRFSTQHMNHLQGSFHSAIEDIREIIGLGTVFYGFEVVREDRQTITVHPGLAFDYQKNRIVGDEPKTLTVEWAEATELYVYIKYEQVEEGVVEEEPTLIWDSCAVIIRPAPPAPGENLIAIAQLTRKPGDREMFEIIGLISSDREDEPGETEPGPQEEETAAQEETGEETNPITAETPSPAKNGQPEEPANETEEVEEVVTEVEEAEGKAPDHGESGQLKVRQGVERLPTEPEVQPEIHLGALLMEPLKKKLNHPEPSGSAWTGELIVPLAEKQVLLDSRVCSLSCHTIVNLNILRQTSDTAANPPVMGQRFQSTAHGEISIVNGQFSQFGLSTIQCYPSQSGTPPWWFSEFTQQGVAHVPMKQGGLGPPPGNTTNSGNGDILENLQFLVRIKEIEAPGFKIQCCLKWNGSAGAISKEMIKSFEKTKITLTWEVFQAWKSYDHDVDYTSKNQSIK
ncbi:MAG: hypothetical protein PVH61_25755 [Candidatus Aminicenantes bacterium]|jgi:hypothetical protein